VKLISFQTNALGISHESKYFTLHIYLTTAYGSRTFHHLGRKQSC